MNLPQTALPNNKRLETMKSSILTSSEQTYPAISSQIKSLELTARPKTPLYTTNPDPIQSTTTIKHPHYNPTHEQKSHNTVSIPPHTRQAFNNSCPAIALKPWNLRVHLPGKLTRPKPSIRNVV